MLHAAAWTDVDGAEDDPQDAAAVNVGGTRHVAELGAPLVYYSTDYVFDGQKSEPYVESDAPNPLSAYGRTKLYGEGAAGEQAWVVRSSGLFGPSGTNFVTTMLRLAREQDEVAVVDDQRSAPTYVGHLAAATQELLDRPYLDYGARPRRAASGLFSAREREGRTEAPALARWVTRVFGANPVGLRPALPRCLRAQVRGHHAGAHGCTARGRERAEKPP